MVQRRAARFVFQKYRRNASPPVLLNELGWETLAERRAKSKEILVYRIENDLIGTPKKFYHQISIFVVAKQSLAFHPAEYTVGNILVYLPQ